MREKTPTTRFIPPLTKKIGIIDLQKYNQEIGEEEE